MMWQVGAKPLKQQGPHVAAFSFSATRKGAQSKMSQESQYTPEIADKICAQLAEGLSLRTICIAEDMPALSTVFKWLRLHPEFVEQYAHAREAQADALADEILDIADDGSNDWMEREGKNGDKETVIDHEHITRSRLRVDTRKWIASKLKPKKYGDKVETTHTGPNGGAIQTDGKLEVIWTAVDAPRPEAAPQGS